RAHRCFLLVLSPGAFSETRIKRAAKTAVIAIVFWYIRFRISGVGIKTVGTPAVNSTPVVMTGLRRHRTVGPCRLCHAKSTNEGDTHRAALMVRDGARPQDQKHRRSVMDGRAPPHHEGGSKIRERNQQALCRYFRYRPKPYSIRAEYASISWV